MAIGEVMTFAEADRRFPDEWVLLEVTNDDPDFKKAAGRLLGHSPDRRDLDDAFRRFREEKPTAMIAEFWTGDIVPKGVTVVL